MKYILKNRFWITIFFISLFVSLFVYRNLPFSFYQQDEWQGLGSFLVARNLADLVGHIPIYKILLGEGRIFAVLLHDVFFKFVPYNIAPPALFSMILHGVNIFLVFYLTKKMFKNFFLAILAAVFFGVLDTHTNSISWISASVGTLPATTFILISLILFIENQRKISSRRKFFIFLLLYVSMFFKEVGIFCFIFFPLMDWIWNKRSWLKIVKEYWYFIVFFAGNGLMRVLEYKSISSADALFLTGTASGNNYFFTLLTRIIMYPITSFSLNFFAPEQLLPLARTFTNIYYPFFDPNQYPLIVQTVVLDLIAIVLFVIIITTIFVLSRYENYVVKKSLVFLIIFSLLSFTPYILISKSFAYLESRYFYIASISAALIFGFTVCKLYQQGKRFYFRIPIVLVVGLFIFSHFNLVEANVNEIVTVSKERESLIASLYKALPTMTSNKNIIYLNSNEDYYTVGNKLPFQQGTGYTIMVLYYRTGKIPDTLLKKFFLFDIASQGYSEVKGKGFGFFYNKDDLQKTLDENKNQNIKVTHLEYDSIKNQITELTN